MPGRWAATAVAVCCAALVLITACSAGSTPTQVAEDADQGIVVGQRGWLPRNLSGSETVLLEGQLLGRAGPDDGPIFLQPEDLAGVYVYSSPAIVSEPDATGLDVEDSGWRVATMRIVDDRFEIADTGPLDVDSMWPSLPTRPDRSMWVEADVDESSAWLFLDEQGDGWVQGTMIGGGSKLPVAATVRIEGAFGVVDSYFFVDVLLPDNVTIVGPDDEELPIARLGKDSEVRMHVSLDDAGLRAAKLEVLTLVERVR